MSKEHTTQLRVDKWTVAKPLLEAMYREFKELSKKKPDGVVGKPKLAVVNRLLETCRVVLKEEPMMAFLDVLKEDDLPQNSDVILMLSQYITAMEAFKGKYYKNTGYKHEWLVQ